MPTHERTWIVVSIRHPHHLIVRLVVLLVILFAELWQLLELRLQSILLGANRREVPHGLFPLRFFDALEDLADHDVHPNSFTVSWNEHDSTGHTTLGDTRPFSAIL